MTRDEIDRAEWENPANWSEALMGIYFSKCDSRVWAPNRPTTLPLAGAVRK